MDHRAKVSVVVVTSEKREDGKVVRVEQELFRGRLSRAKADGDLVVAKDDESLPIVVGKEPSREAVLRISEVYEATKGLDSAELEVSILVQSFPA